MEKNVGTHDRLARGIAGGALLACSALAPVALELRVVGLGAPGGYLLLTALVGSCLGYRLLGRSSCPGARAARP